MMDKDIFTLSKDVQVGEKLLLAFHRVEVLSVQKRNNEYATCRVRVLGPVPGSARMQGGIDIPIPPMMWHGVLYDTDGRFVEQPRSTT